MHKNESVRYLIGVTCLVLFGFTTPKEPSQKDQSVLDKVLERGLLRVGITADYMPFSYYDADRKSYQGIDIDLAKQLAKDMEVEVEFVPTNRKSLTRDILLGKFDVAMSGLPRTMKQTLITNMTTGYFESGKSLLIRQQDKVLIKDLASANKPKFTVGVKQATTSQKFAELYLSAAQLIFLSTPEDLKEALKNGVVDVVLTDNIEAKVLADMDAELHAVDPYHPLNTEVLAFAMPPGDKKWQEFLNLWVLHQLQEGEVLRLQEKWVGE